MSTDSTDICGHIKNDGEECEFQPKYPDGKCGFHTEEDEPIEEDTRDGPGRPTKLTYEKQEKIASDIEQGRSMASAARKQDITPQTVHNWMQRGESDKEEGKENEYTEFFERLTRAKGYGEEWYFQAIMDLAQENEDHRFLMSLMKQRYPDSWGETETGVDADTVKLEVSERVSKSWPEQ